MFKKSIDPILFVHIPKTAGTSFREALNKNLGRRNICLDYGDNELGSTSDIVKKFYSDSDIFNFYLNFSKKSYRALSGHFGAWKYSSIFPIYNMVSFVREPVIRTLSEYSHFKRNLGYQGSFSDFYHWERSINLQSRYLYHVPWRAMGLLGVAEKYNDSLRVFSQQFGLKLRPMIHNVDPEYFASTVDVEENELNDVRLLNQKDCALYDEVCSVLQQRLDYMKEGEHYTFMGGRYDEGSSKLHLWAYQANSDVAVRLHIIVNGSPFVSGLAKEYRGDMLKFGAPRKGHVGWVVDISKDILLNSLVIRVTDSGQSLTIPLP